MTRDSNGKEEKWHRSAPWTSEVKDMEQDAAGEEMQRLLSELHRYAEVTQLVAERFA